MQMGQRRSERFVEALLEKMETSSLSVGIAPSFPLIQALATRAAGSFLKIGAQNVSEFSEGAYTGEVAATVLKEIGAHFVIIGHSERRTHFQETDDAIHQKIARALESGLLPIVCVGETKKERDHGRTQEVLADQLEGAFKPFSNKPPKDIVIAYEPVWAIGTGESATPEEAQKIHESIRNFIKMEWGERAAEKLSILYGGSVKPSNLSALIKNPDVDGALVGGASLEVESFVTLIKEAEGARL